MAVLAWIVLIAARASAFGAATNEEYALLVFANQARSDPAAFGFAYPAVPPLVWNDALAAAARAHSTDMAQNGCYQHDSCNGRTWWKRVQSYYPDWTWLGENIIPVGDTPQQMHDGWMRSEPHRANILGGGFAEFGAGIAIGDAGFGPIAFGTEDFGTRALLSLRSLPALPAAAVLPRTGPAGERRLVANFYDYDGAPQAVRARVGSTCVDLRLETGKPAHGTYAATRSFTGAGCVPLLFEAVKGDGSVHRFPSEGAILIAVGDAGCPQRTATPPAATCGAADPQPAPPSAPTPTPHPAPTPRVVGDAALDKLRAVFAPGPADGSKGQVVISATLPALPGFDPTGVSIRLAASIPSGDWMRALPASCGARPCIEPNRAGTVFRGRYGGPQLTFTRRADGRWQMHFTSRREKLLALAPGAASLRFTIGDLELSGTGTGKLRQRNLVVD